MQENPAPPPDAPEMRRRAEERLREQHPETGQARTEAETQRLVHELQVHQIELEMQNAELQQARCEMEKALEKRPYTDVGFQKLVHKIERDIQKKRRGQLTTAELGDIVMKHLRLFDKVAYIRFASVYRSFEDVKTFESELKKLLGEKKLALRASKRKK